MKIRPTLFPAATCPLEEAFQCAVVGFLFLSGVRKVGPWGASGGDGAAQDFDEIWLEEIWKIC